MISTIFQVAFGRQRRFGSKLDRLLVLKVAAGVGYIFREMLCLLLTAVEILFERKLRPELILSMTSVYSAAVNRDGARQIDGVRVNRVRLFRPTYIHSPAGL